VIGTTVRPGTLIEWWPDRSADRPAPHSSLTECIQSRSRCQSAASWDRGPLEHYRPGHGTQRAADLWHEDGRFSL